MTVAYNWTGLRTATKLTISQLAEQAAESIRALSHLTLPGAEVPGDPAEACEVVASLARVTGRLPQLLGQLSRWLINEHRTRQLRLDAWSPRHDVGRAVMEAVVDLTEASQAARQAGRTLDAANQVFAHLAAAVDEWVDAVEHTGYESVTRAREGAGRNACPE